MTWSLVVFLSGMPFILLALLIPPAWLPLLMVGLGLLEVGVIALLVELALLPRQRSLEMQSGYTTLRGHLRDVDMVDHRTGILLRKAGEPLLTTDEYAARLASIREPEERG